MTKNIVFIDSQVQDHAALTSTFDADTEWFLLNDDEDGVVQMQSVLSRYSGLEAIHIVSHGAPGALYLGGTLVHSGVLPRYALEFQKIGASLTATGDVLLYGCSAAQGILGTQFINLLVQYTGADVAASSDATGSAAIGGNWVLEQANGDVRTSPLSYPSFPSLLGTNTAPTFTGPDGKLTTSMAYGMDVVIQSDGKILVAGSDNVNKSIVLRYLADGSLDGDFGVGGKVVSLFGGSSSFSKIAIQSDGRILAVGSGYDDIRNTVDYLLVRYHADGRLDASFSIDGNVKNNFTDYKLQPSIAIQKDGKILFVGGNNSGSLIIRFNEDGTLDNTFGRDGVVTLAYDIGLMVADVVFQEDGKIILIGTSGGDYYGTNFALARYNINGSLDSSFGNEGVVSTDVSYAYGWRNYYNGYGKDVVIQSDGKILAAGLINFSSNYYYGDKSDFALVRYNIDGSLDTNFGGDGIITTDFDSKIDSGYSVALQADGKILVAGSSSRLGIGAYQSEFAIARYNIDGSLDSSFSSDGKVTTDFSAYSYASALSMTIQTDGKIVVLGNVVSVDEFGSSQSSVALARYNPDGSLDYTFSPAENTLLASPTYTENDAPIVLDAGAQILDAELLASNSYLGASLTLSRQGGASTQDVFSAISGGTLTPLTASSYFSVDGATTIGRVIRNSEGILTLTFNANATQTLINRAMQQIAYANTSDAPPENVSIDWTFTDGNTGAQGAGGALSVTGTTTVSITSVNDAPGSSLNTLPALTISTGIYKTYQLPAGTFTDIDGDVLSYSLAMSDGTAVPPWLSIDRQTGALGGIPTEFDLGTFNLQVIAHDNSGSIAIVNLPLHVNGSPTGSVSISGTPSQGQTLIASNNLADVDGLGVISYQWLANGVQIRGATNSKLILSQEHVDKNISVQVTYIDGQGTLEKLGSDTTNKIFNSINDAPYFATGGKFAVDFGSSSQSDGKCVVIQLDGKILIGGSSSIFNQSTNTYENNFFVTRCNSDGTLDASFGEGGKVTTYFRSGEAQSIAVQADGKILISGYSEGGAAILRYNSDGSLDSGFDGDGKLLINSLSGGSDYKVSLATQADGKILIAGLGNGGSILTRYNSNGLLDASFDVDGLVATSTVDGSGFGIQRIILQADGKILAGGSSGSGFALVRYNNDGSLDTTFGGDGGSTANFGFDVSAQGVMLQSDGKIVIAGFSFGNRSIPWAFCLARFNSDGSLDTSFGNDGKISTAIESAGYAYSVAQQVDGKIIVAGTSYIYSPAGSHFDFALVRYNSDGSLDTSLDHDGKLTTDFYYGSRDFGRDVAVQADGKIVIVGSAGNDGNNLVLARYNANGTLDTHFGTLESKTLAGSQTYIENDKPVLLNSTNTILDPDLTALNNGIGNYNNASVTLSRHGAASTEDEFFGLHNLSLIDGNAVLSGETVGVFTYQSGTLSITFNGNATQARVNELMTSIGYANGSDTPPASAQIDWTFDDGNTGDQGSGSSLRVTGSTTISITPVNDVPTGSVWISGMPSMGQVLTAISDFDEPDGLGVLNYQWLADEMAIYGATDWFYRPTLDVVGKKLSVTVSYVDAYGSPESLTSGPTKAVYDPGGDPQGSLSIAGTFQQGQLLTAINTLSDVNGMNRVSYQWYEENDGQAVPISDAISVVLSQEQVSKKVWLVVSYLNDYIHSKNILANNSYGVVSNINDVPTGRVTITGTATQGQTLTVANTLADDDGIPAAGNGAITYQWRADGVDISDANASSFTLTQAQVGKTISVKASYTDNYGQAESVLSTDTDAVENVNDVPTAANLSAAESYTEDTALNLADIVITDVDGANVTATLTLSYAAAGALSTATSGAVTSTYNADTGVWSAYGSLADVNTLLAGVTFNPTLNFNANFTLANSVSDGVAPAITGTKSFTGTAVNDAPVATNASRSTNENTALNASLPAATDAENNSLTYAKVGDPAHGTVVLNPDGRYTYTPRANYSGTDSFTYKVNDGTADSSTATVSITVTPVNDAPVLANPLADRSVTLGSSLNFAFAGNTFTDVDSPSLTYTAKLANGTALPSWLSFNPTTRTFSGTPTAANLGTLTVQVTASDGALSVADTFDLVISERPNTSPTASNTSVSTKEDTPLTGALPGATDAEGDPVTYAKASDPAKGTVSVNPSGAFTYTPAANANGDDSFTYTVTDDRGASSTYTVSLTINPVNDAPVITPLAPLVFVDTAQSDVFVLEQAGQIQAQDIDSASLSYRISGGTNVGAYSTVQGTYGSLQVHTGTGAYTFFANNAAIQALKSNASETFTLTVSDGALTAEAPMTVQIRGANDAPVLIAPLSDQTAYDAAAWSLTLSGAQFSDADTGDVLTYTATLANGAALPTWLSFDPATRMFSGTPSAADVGSLSIRVSASDGSLSASDVFSLVVNEYFEPVVDDSSVATYARSANQYTIRFDPVSKDLLVTDTDPQQYEVRKFTNAKRIEFADLTLNLAVSDLADTIAEPALNRIAELYVAFFNRVPDGDGMEFWLGQYRQGKTINDIADAFYNAGVYFSDLTGYRADMSNDDFIHIVYRNVLGRPEGADQEGLAFWRTELDSGRSAKGTLVSSILDAAHGSTFSDPTNPYHWVQKLLDNKLEVAKQVSVDWGVNYNSSEDSIAKGQAIAAAITPDDTSMAISLVGVVVTDVV